MGVVPHHHAAREEDVMREGVELGPVGCFRNRLSRRKTKWEKEEEEEKEEDLFRPI